MDLFPVWIFFSGNLTENERFLSKETETPGFNFVKKQNKTKQNKTNKQTNKQNKKQKNKFNILCGGDQIFLD